MQQNDVLFGIAVLPGNTKFAISFPGFSPTRPTKRERAVSQRFGHPPPGMPKTLGIWEWGCPKRGDAQNAVTAGRREPWERGC